MIIKWFKRFSVAAMLLVLLATSAIYLTPLDVYVPEVEQALSSNFGEPVTIQHLRLDAFPLPHLTLQAVTIGSKQDVALKSVGIFFDLGSLLKAQRVIHRLVLEQGSITQQQLAKILVWSGRTSVGATSLRLDKLQFSGIYVVMPGLTLGPLQGQLELAADSSLSKAWVIMPAQQGVVQIFPQQGGGFRMEAGFRNWAPPGYPKWVMDSFNVKGILAGSHFQASRFSAEMLGARIKGSANLDWQSEWKMDVHLTDFEGQLEGLLPLLGSGIEAKGMLHAKGQLASQGASAQELSDNLSLDLNVDLKNAAIRLPFNSRSELELDSVSTHVTGTPQKIRLGQLQARLYGGTLSGTSVVQQAQGLLGAEVAFDNISLQPLVDAFSSDVMLTGQLNGQAKLTTRMNEFDRFPANTQLVGSFRIMHGVVGKVDLVQAASNPLTHENKGGKTRFDELSGLLSMDGSGYHLRRLKISSGAVNATGKLDISPQLKLNGSLDTYLKGTATLVSIPLAVAGTVRDPVLYPSGSVLAGAAVGTALLGPGLGTALGIQVGNLLHKLFGSDNEKTKPEDKNKQEQHRTPAK